LIAKKPTISAALQTCDEISSIRFSKLCNEIFAHS
jgi:hypothetical protein